MARCSCGNAACSCVIKGAPDGGVTVTGSGSPERPYLLSLTTGGEPLDSLEMVDSSTVVWSKLGAGTPLDHRRYIATAAVGMRELTDVSKTDVPVTGDAIQWNGTEWVFAAPGATTVPVSGTWGTAPLTTAVFGTSSLVGREIYLDSNGQLRSKPDEVSGTIANHPVTALGGTYPVGTSVMYVSTTDGASWPTAAAATVVTHRTANVAVIQWCFFPSATSTRGYVRSGVSTAWGPWQQVAGAVPHYSAYRSTAQAMAVANTWYTATYDQTDVAEGGVTSSGGVITVPVAGKYQIDFASHVQNTTSTSSVTLRILRNGVSICDYSNGAVGSNKSWPISKLVKCAAGDTIQAQVKTSTAGTNMYGASGTRYTYIDITLVGG